MSQTELGTRRRWLRYTKRRKPVVQPCSKILVIKFVGSLLRLSKSSIRGNYAKDIVGIHTVEGRGEEEWQNDCDNFVGD